MRHARDMRERRDADRLGSHLMWPVSFIRLVSLGYPEGSSPVLPDTRAIEFQKHRNSCVAACMHRICVKGGSLLPAWCRFQGYSLETRGEKGYRSRVTI